MQSALRRNLEDLNYQHNDKVSYECWKIVPENFKVDGPLARYVGAVVMKLVGKDESLWEQYLQVAKLMKTLQDRLLANLESLVKAGK